MRSLLHPPKALLFGEILWDEVQAGDHRLGGAPLNAAFHLQYLGVPCRIISRVGRDDLGQQAIEEMERRGLTTAGVQRDDRFPTGQAVVKPRADGSQAFEILQPSAWDHIASADLPEPGDLQRLSLFYFGTLSQRHEVSAGALEHLIRRLPGQTLRFLDLNLREPFYTSDNVGRSLLAADMVKMSREELDEVAKIGGIRAEPIAEALPKLIDEFDLERVVVTDGPHSVHGYDSRSQTLYEVAPPRLSHDQMAEADTVGAGDAFSAVLMAGEVYGIPWTVLLEKAAEYAAAVCQFRGAFPADTGILPKAEQFLRLPTADD